MGVNSGPMKKIIRTKKEVQIMEKVRFCGFILLGVGVVICIAYMLYQFVQAADVPTVIRLGVVVILVGIGFLLLSVIKERFEEEK